MFLDNKRLKKKFSKKSLNPSSIVVCRVTMEQFSHMDKLDQEKLSQSQEEQRGMSTEESFPELFLIFLERHRGILPRISASVFPI